MMIVEFLSYLLFPGVLLTLYLSLASSWLYRKLVARMENRVGPPFNQPVFDVAKLMAKERMYPKKANYWIMHYLPRIQVGIALLITLFIPLTGTRGLLSFQGDLFVVLFLITLHGSTSFFIGTASRNPYTISGAGRAVFTEISLELPLSLGFAGMAVMTGTMRIAEISLEIDRLFWQSWNSVILLIPWLILLISVLYATLGACELNPFSAAHAETEIVEGWSVELSGADLAYARIAEYVDLFSLSGLIAALFLGVPIIMELKADTGFNQFVIGLVAFLTMIIKIGIILFLLAFIATTNSRLRIDQITDVLWSLILPSVIIAFGLIIVINIPGGMIG